MSYYLLQRCKLLVFAVVLAVFGVGFVSEGVRGEQFPVTLSCTSESDGQGSKEITLVSGQPSKVQCTATKITPDKSYELFLLGNRSFAQGTTSEASSTSFSLAANAAASGFLEFPAVFQPGEYQYTFTLYDTVSKQPIADVATLRGVLKGKERATLGSVSVDQERYEWEAPLKLSLGVKLFQDTTLEASPLTVRVVLQNNQGEECAVLVENQPLSEFNESISMKLPKKGKCTNELTVSLKDKEGTVLDQKNVAIGLPVSEASMDDRGNMVGAVAWGGSLSIWVKLGLGVVVFLVIVLIGIRIMSRRQVGGGGNSIG